MELHWSLSKTLFKDRIIKIIKFAISVALLFFIFKKVDWARILETFRSIDLLLFCGSFIIGHIIQLFLCVFRWQQILKICCQIQAGYITLLKTYWSSLFIGYFVPAGLGSDIYRVSRLAMTKGFYGKQITTVLFEKIYIFLADIILILATYMLVYPLIMPGTNMQEIKKVMGGIATAGILLILVMVALRYINMASCIEYKLKTYLFKLKKKAPSTLSIGSILEPFTSFKNTIIFVFLTILIRITISSLGGWCLFASLGVSLPFKVHIFAWSVMYILLKLPVSIGSFGVREVSYVILFGFFGVEKEVALTASFLGLASTLCLTLLGGINIKFPTKPGKAN